MGDGGVYKGGRATNSGSLEAIPREMSALGRRAQRIEISTYRVRAVEPTARGLLLGATRAWAAVTPSRAR